MIFEVFSIQPASQQTVNGVDQYTHHPIFIEGKGKHVKIVPDSTNVLTGDERLSSDYNPYIINNSLKAVISFIDLPSDLYLDVGEKLYLSTLSNSTRIVVKVLHYDKPKNTPSPNGFTGTIELNPTS